MEDFRIIYRILKILHNSMNLEEIDKASISAETLKISEPRWCRIMNLLAVNELISGVFTHWREPGKNYPQISLEIPEITLKGLEYLQENSLMQKAANLA